MSAHETWLKETIMIDNPLYEQLDRIENQNQMIIDRLDKLLEKKKPVKARSAKKNVYSPVFEGDWKAYPTTKGANKAKAHRAWMQRIRDGEIPAIITLGVLKYAACIEATGRYAKLPETFFGPDKHYENDWTIPAQPITVPRDDNLLAAFAVKHGLHKHGEAPQSIRNNFEYRRWIEEKL